MFDQPVRLSSIECKWESGDKYHAGEILPEHGHTIQRLANLTYTTASFDIRETMSKHFADALVDSEMQLAYQSQWNDQGSRWARQDDRTYWVQELYESDHGWSWWNFKRLKSLRHAVLVNWGVWQATERYQRNEGQDTPLPNPEQRFKSTQIKTSSWCQRKLTGLHDFNKDYFVYFFPTE